MEYRNLEIKVISANVLEELVTDMFTYAVVSISGDPQTMQKTTEVKDGGTNPTWNSLMKFTIDESAAQLNRLTLIFQVFGKHILGDQLIGEVHVPVKELVNAIGDHKPSIQFIAYNFMEPSGKPKGVLNFSYKLGEKFRNAAVAVAIAGYPSPVVAPSFVQQPLPPATWPCPPPLGGHPPPPPYCVYPVSPTLGYGHPFPAYGYPPMQGYGYPLQPGHGYPVQLQRPAKLYGLGFGAGLLGHLHAGMLMSDLVCDAAGYVADSDSGFGDVGDIF